MPDTLFHQFVDSEGWSEATQVGLLLRYIGAQDDLTTFADFLAQCRETERGGVSDPADRFMWEVAERLRNPGLTLNAAFQSFCANAFDLLTPDQAAERWCCWSVA
jgi:hypothetical protein